MLISFLWHWAISVFTCNKGQELQCVMGWWSPWGVVPIGLAMWGGDWMTSLSDKGQLYNLEWIWQSFCFKSSHVDYKAPWVRGLILTQKHHWVWNATYWPRGGLAKWEQRARRKRTGNGRKWGAFGNRKSMSFAASYPAIIAIHKGHLGNASAQKRAQIKQYRGAVCCLGCVDVYVLGRGDAANILVLFTFSLGHWKSTNIPPIFYNLQG